MRSYSWYKPKPQLSRNASEDAFKILEKEPTPDTWNEIDFWQQLNQKWESGGRQVLTGLCWRINTSRTERGTLHLRPVSVAPIRIGDCVNVWSWNWSIGAQCKHGRRSRFGGLVAISSLLIKWKSEGNETEIAGNGQKWRQSWLKSLESQYAGHVAPVKVKRSTVAESSVLGKSNGKVVQKPPLESQSKYLRTYIIE